MPPSEGRAFELTLRVRLWAFNATWAERKVQALFDNRLWPRGSVEIVDSRELT